MSTLVSKPNKPTENNLAYIESILLSLFFFTVVAAILYPWIKPEVIPLGPLNDRVQGASSPTTPSMD